MKTGLFTRTLLGGAASIDRLRNWAKAKIPKDSWLYRGLTAPSMMARKMTSNPRALSGDSIFYRESELPMCSLLPTEVLKLTLNMFKPQTMLDVGCGTGKALDFLLEAGVDVTGLEGSELAIEHARNKSHITQCDLRNEIDLKRKFDLVWCFEVVEHLPEKYADTIVNTMTRHADAIVMSAAHPGQGGEGHFNEQFPEYWIQKFEERGFSLQEERTELLRKSDPYWGPNLMVFGKGGVAKS